MEAIAIAGKSVLGGIDPAGVVTVGTRELKHGWTIFFDNPRKRPFESFPLTLARSDIDVRAEGGYTKVIVGGAAAGPFSGTYEFTIYPGSRLVRAAMVMTTQRPAKIGRASCRERCVSTCRSRWAQYLSKKNKH